MPGGRPPTGVDLVDGFEASEIAKLRCKAILETISGAKSIAEACEATGLKEAMIHMLRTQAIQGALGALEPKPMGRPRKTEEADPQELERLRAQSAELEEEIRKLRVKADYHEARESLRKKEKVSEKKTEARAQKR